jgi:hypothetical protein
MSLSWILCCRAGSRIFASAEDEQKAKSANNSKYRSFFLLKVSLLYEPVLNSSCDESQLASNAGCLRRRFAAMADGGENRKTSGEIFLSKAFGVRVFRTRLAKASQRRRIFRGSARRNHFKHSGGLLSCPNMDSYQRAVEQLAQCQHVG